MLACAANNKSHTERKLFLALLGDLKRRFVRNLKSLGAFALFIPTLFYVRVRLVLVQMCASTCVYNRRVSFHPRAFRWINRREKCGAPRRVHTQKERRWRVNFTFSVQSSEYSVWRNPSNGNYFCVPRAQQGGAFAEKRAPLTRQKRRCASRVECNQGVSLGRFAWWKLWGSSLPKNSLPTHSLSDLFYPVPGICFHLGLNAQSNEHEQPLRNTSRFGLKVSFF